MIHARLASCRNKVVINKVFGYYNCMTKLALLCKYYECSDDMQRELIYLNKLYSLPTKCFMSTRFFELA